MSSSILIYICFSITWSVASISHVYTPALSVVGKPREAISVDHRIIPRLGDAINLGKWHIFVPKIKWHVDWKILGYYETLGYIRKTYRNCDLILNPVTPSHIVPRVKSIWKGAIAWRKTGKSLAPVSIPGKYRHTPTSHPGAAPTTSLFSTEHVASMDSAKATGRGDKKHLTFMIWCAYIWFWRLFKFCPNQFLPGSN